MSAPMTLDTVPVGDNFDIKAFHDALLTKGAMTLPMLKESVRKDLMK